MKHSIFFLFLIQCWSCQSGDSSKPSAEIRNNTLIRYLADYTQAVKQRKSYFKVITANFEIKMDTVIIQIINSNPDLTLTKVNAVTNYEDFQIYLTGDYPDSNYYALSSSQDKKKVIDKSREIKSFGNFEPLYWKLFFLDGELIKSYKGDSLSL